MSKAIFLGGEVQLFDNAGAPLAGGKVYFYEPGTSTAKDTYTDSTLGTANANPVVLDAYGRAPIWLSGSYKVVVKDSTDVTLYTEDNINPSVSSVLGNFNLADNGSFETDTNADGTPDSWTLTTYTGATCQRVTNDQNHGAAAMKFVSVGNGGGYLESESFFEVSPDTDLGVEFDIKSSVVDVRNVVDVLWYDSAKAVVSTTSVYDESAANPTSWTHKNFTATPPATARYAKLRLYGCHSSDVTPGTTWYDNVTAWAEHQPAAHTHTASEISDSTATGRSVLTAATAAAGRTALAAQQDVITTRGDIVIASAAGAAARLAKGTSGQVLQMGANDPAWAPMILAQSYDSGEQTITAAGLLTLAHGLGAKPKVLEAVLVCKTAEYNYSVGDEVLTALDAASVSRGASCVWDATNINIRFGSSATTFYLLDKTTGAIQATTNANWKLIVRAYA